MDASTEEVRIELVPLIDVIFCILTFFILAAVGLSRQQAISVDLPQASTGTPQGKEILMVSLDDLGQVYVEKNLVVTRNDFIQAMQTHRQQNPQGLMALYASPNASYNEVVQVLDLMREVGGDRVALATLPGESQQTPDVTPSQPPTTGVPGFTPYSGQPPLTPDGNLNPYGLPQLPGNLGQPGLGLPGMTPGNLPPSPAQPQITPGSSLVPNPGTSATPPANNTTP